ncbi:MAG: hypothetical protein JSR77_08295 [Planctomycetes bacterium]|nr:hypothetical protein [Planctomycetota bacterium]
MASTIKYPATTRRIRPWCGCACAVLLSAGCESAGQGAVSGGAIGALGGLAIGSMTGSAGKGAAIGAISGAVAGGVIGDQNQRARQSQQGMRYGGY